MLFWNRWSKESASRVYFNISKKKPHARHARRSTALVQTWMDQSETLLLFFAETNQRQSCSRVPQSSWFLSSTCSEELWVEIDFVSRWSCEPFLCACGKTNRGILVPNATWLSFFLKDGGGKRKFNSSASSSQNSDLRAEENGKRWTKRTIWGYRESKCRGNLKTNQRMLWRRNRLNVRTLLIYFRRETAQNATNLPSFYLF